MTPRYALTFSAVVVPLAAIVLGFAQPAVAQQALFQTSAKFVCGAQKPISPNQPGEPTVKPGNYATEININNIQFSQQFVFKQVALVVRGGEPVGREPRAQPASGFVAVPMPPRSAMMDDCNAIWELAFPGTVPPNPMPLTIGYLSIISLSDIDVDAVYTTHVFEPQLADSVAEAPSIDVERVPTKRITLTATGAAAAGLPPSVLRGRQ